MNEVNKNLEAALEYLRLGWSVIPVGQDKKPLIEWGEYKNKLPEKERVEAWFKKASNTQVAIVTGAISDLAVVDIEAGGKTEDLPNTVISKTGGGGFHYYYKHPGKPIKNGVRVRELTDIRGDGGYVVAPPSLHLSGKNYEWVVPPGISDIADFPEWIIGNKKSNDKLATDWNVKLHTEVGEGQRNDTAASIAGKILKTLPAEEWEIEGWTYLQKWNANFCKPPITLAELQSVWGSIKSRETIKQNSEGESVEKKILQSGAPKKSQADQLVGLVEDNRNIVLFHNEHHDPYLQMLARDHKEIWACKSKQMRRWLAREFWENYAKAPSSEAVRSALNIIEAKACFDGEMFKLHNRVAWHEKAIWYDLSDAGWRAVKITPEGWNIEANPPILFQRFGHQLPQVEPQRGDSLKDFLNLVNITNEDQKILLLVWIVSCYIPGFPHPIPSFYGAHGAAKSGLCRLVLFLVDPSSADLLTMPSQDKEDDWALVISKHWLAIFDNLSNIPGKISDLLCKAVTGGGFETRELYTNSDSVIFTFKHCMALNSLSLVAVKPDLLDRSLLFKMDRAQVNRKDEAAIAAEFDRLRPLILGDIFTVVGQAMKIKADIKIKELPRMADFALWGAAIAEVLGYGQEAFLTAYSRNINIQNEEVLKDSLVGTVVRHFMETTDFWKETPSETLAIFTEVAKELGINVEKEREWPKGANSLSRKLNELKTNLAEDGIKVDTDQRIGKSRAILLLKPSKNIVSIGGPSEPQENPIDFGDDKPPVFHQIPHPVSSPLKPNNIDTKNDGNDTNGIISYLGTNKLFGDLSQVFPGASLAEDEDTDNPDNTVNGLPF